jgi:hypothetical protein
MVRNDPIYRLSHTQKASDVTNVTLSFSIVKIASIWNWIQRHRLKWIFQSRRGISEFIIHETLIKVLIIKNTM